MVKEFGDLWSAVAAEPTVIHSKHITQNTEQRHQGPVGSAGKPGGIQRQ